MTTRTNSAKWTGTRWRIDVQKDGQRKSFYSSKTGRTGQREANAKADKWLETGVAPTSMRVDAVWELYLKDVRATTGTSNYDRTYKNGKNYILPVVGHLKMCKLTEGKLQDVLNLSYKNGNLNPDGERRSTEPLSKKSRQGIRSTETGFIKWARKQGYTTLHEKMLDLEVPKGARTKEKHILQPESLRVLFSTETCLFRGKPIFDDNIYCYRFIVASGLRPGEAVGLRLGDFTGRRVDISRSINRYNETTKGKNENAVRYIEMNDKAYEAYMGQLYLLQAWRVPRTPDTPLFPLVNQQSLYNHWRHYQETNGIPHISLYELRHTFVSIAQDLPDGKLKALVGHSKNMDTRGTYAHRIEGQAHETATAMTAAFDKVLNA